MTEFLYVLGIIFSITIISFVMINIKQIVTGQKFSGTCASANPALRNQMGECPGCGLKVDEPCED